MNKKLLFGVVGVLFSMALVTAGVVSYLSNTVEFPVDWKSPMEITTDADFPLSYAGDTLTINSVTTNRASVPVENVLVEVKVLDFDGVGITYFHSDCQGEEVHGVDCWEGDIPVCTVEGDANAYYYIGPAGGFTAPVDYNMEATSKITSDTTLEPRLYDVEIKVVTAATRVC